MSLSPPPSRPARSYEDLRGGQGASIYYRAERFRPRALLERTLPAVQVGERSVQLYDRSATGLSYLANARDSLPEAGAHLPVRLAIPERSVGESLRTFSQSPSGIPVSGSRGGLGSLVQSQSLVLGNLPIKLRYNHYRAISARGQRCWPRIRIHPWEVPRGVLLCRVKEARGTWQ